MAEPKTICHQFPLRPDYLAQLVVPRDLTREEADRLCEFVRSLAQPAGVLDWPIWRNPDDTYVYTQSEWAAWQARALGVKGLDDAQA